MALGLVMPLARYRPVDAAGAPYSGARLYAYLAGTTTPTDLYTTSALTTPHAWPVVADSGGLFAAIYLSQSLAYKIVLMDADDVPVWSQDNVSLAPVSELEAIKVGGITLSGQVANDVIYATSASQLGVIHSEAHAALVTAADGAPVFAAGAVRRLSHNVTPVSNSGTGETDLMSCTIPALTITANGMGVDVLAFGTSANNANTKTIRVYVGGALVLGTTIQIDGTPWRVRLSLRRVGSNTSVITADATGVATTGVVGAYLDGSVSMLDSVLIKVTGQSGTGSADITQKAMSVVMVS